jgi:hypothetical protein
MDWQSLWQGVFVHWVAVALAAGGAALLALLKEKGQPWVTPILYGIGAFGLIMFSLIGIQLWFTSSPAERITPENVESHVRNWLDTYGVAVARTTNDTTYFTFGVTLHNGIGVLVSRPRTRDRYLSLEARVDLSEEHKMMLTKMSPEDATRFMDEISLEIVRARIGVTQIGTPLQAVTVQKTVPIRDLSEYLLANSLDEVDSDVNIIREAIRLAIIPTPERLARRGN